MERIERADMAVPLTLATDALVTGVALLPELRLRASEPGMESDVAGLTATERLIAPAEAEAP